MSKDFAQKLKGYRTLARMTQTDLARSTGITRGMVNNYEQGASEPAFAVLCKLAEVLGVELTDLVTPGSIPDFTRRMQVTDEEAELLQIWREADPVYRTVALDILKAHKRRKEDAD